jgi:alpha-ribazole phosphatase
MVASLILLRHGKTSHAGKMVGSTDVDLEIEGIAQIKAIRPLVQAEKFDRVFCSPMRRCRQTAEILDLDIDISYHDALKEINFGLWEGMEFSEIEKKNPEQVGKWVEDPDGFCFPEGECRADFISRLEVFKKSLLALEQEKALIITHGGVIRHFICSFLGIPANNYLLFHVREGLLASLACFGERGVLTGLNIGREG